MKKFLCDQMCAEVGRWLRASGYDTAIITTSMRDEAIYQQALEEKRLLITRDTGFLKIDPQEEHIIYLRSDDLEESAKQLKKAGVDWLFHPFTRCLQCNGPLNKMEQMPLEKQLWACSFCNHLFWRGSHTENMEKQMKAWNESQELTIGLGGDLMLGRLVNENLDNATPSYVWGNLHPLLKSTDINLVNLENTFTKSAQAVPKVFNFKADPEKVSVLKEGPVHIVNIANNHILDYGEEGLFETIEVLDHAHIHHVGAGININKALEPCIMEKNGVKIGFLGCTDNESTWKATSTHPGTFFVEVGDFTDLAKCIKDLRTKVDILILSIHWGPNMRQHPLPSFQKFAHGLIDLGIDILHGHSAHIFQGIEVYKKGLILYDTGDFVDDYAVDPLLRNDRSFFFIVKLDKKGLISLKMIPTLISKFQVNIAHDPDSLELMERLSEDFNTFFKREKKSLLLMLR